MWYTYCSTGFPELDHDLAKIDDLLLRVSSAASLEEEHEYMIATYSAIIDHIQFKNDFLSLKMSREDQERDVNFLRFVRGKIKERSRGLIRVEHLVSDLRHMLIIHAMTYYQQKQAV